MPPADLPRHASLASSRDECDSTITRVSASEGTVDRGLFADSVDLITNVGADVPDYRVKQTKYRDPKIDPKMGRPRSPAKAFTRISDLRRDVTVKSAYLSATDIVNDMVTVHLGSKEIPDAAFLPVKELPSLDQPSSDDKWIIKDFEPIREDGSRSQLCR